MSTDCSQIGAELLFALSARGVRLRAVGEELRVRCEQGELSSEELQTLRRCKPELLQQLRVSDALIDAAIERRAGDAAVPLTAAQRLIWNAVARSDALAVRSCVEATRIRGPLNGTLLQDCIHALVRRHESLRTRIVSVAGSVCQRVEDAAGEPDFIAIDLQRSGSTELEATAAQLAKEFLMTPIEPSEGPLFGARLFQLSADDHVLIIAAHHLIADGVSTQILNSEIFSMYERGAAGQLIELSPLAIQFCDYALWQRCIQPTWFRRHARYWTEHLKCVPHACIPVASESIKPARPTAVTQPIPFGAGLSAELAQIARREQTMLALTVLTVYCLAMSQWCQLREFLLVFVSNGRHRPEVDGMVGNLVFHLHLRIKIAPDDTLLDVLRQVTSEYRSAYEHQDFGWVPQFVPECRDAYAYFDLRFNWLPTYWSAAQEPTARTIQTSPFALNVDWSSRWTPGKFTSAFIHTPEEVTALVQYRPDLLEPASVDRFARNLLKIAESLVNQPHQRISALTLE